MYIQNIIKRTLLGIFAFGVIGYALYATTPLLSGPQITINSQEDSANNEVITIRGIAKRTKELHIFDKLVDMNEDGEFSEYIIKHDLYTVVIIKATDKWGKSKEIKLNIN